VTCAFSHVDDEGDMPVVVATNRAVHIHDDADAH
jgi:hypothetical protein